MRRYNPDCQAPGHVGSRKNTPTRHFHETVSLDEVGIPRRIIPFCDKCTQTHKHQTSVWTPALIEEYYVQEIMES